MPGGGARAGTQRVRSHHIAPSCASPQQGPEPPASPPAPRGCCSRATTPRGRVPSRGHTEGGRRGPPGTTPAPRPLRLKKGDGYRGDARGGPGSSHPARPLPGAPRSDPPSPGPLGPGAVPAALPQPRGAPGAFFHRGDGRSPGPGAAPSLPGGARRRTAHRSAGKLRQRRLMRAVSHGRAGQRRLGRLPAQPVPRPAAGPGGRRCPRLGPAGHRHRAHGGDSERAAGGGSPGRGGAEGSRLAPRVARGDPRGPGAAAGARSGRAAPGAGSGAVPSAAPGSGARPRAGRRGYLRV